MKTKLAFLLFFIATITSCGTDKVPPASTDTIQKNKATYQGFISEFSGISRALAQTRLDQFNLTENDVASTFKDYANQVESSPLFNQEYDYIEGFLYRAGEEVIRTMISSLLQENGLGLFSSTSNGIVEVFIEDPIQGMYEYKINQQGAFVTGCDNLLVDCFIDFDLHIRLQLLDSKPTLSAQSGLFSYQFTLPQLSISILQFELSNSQIQLNLAKAEHAAQIELMLIDFDLLSGATGIAMNITRATSTVDFELSENIDNGIRFNGIFSGLLEQIDLNFSRINENIIVVSKLAQLDVQVQGVGAALLPTTINYHYWSDDSSLVNDQTYPFRLGIADKSSQTLPLIDLNWNLDLNIIHDSNVALSLHGSGRKQNKHNYQIEYMELNGSILQSHYFLTARIEQSTIAEIQAQGSCTVSLIGDLGVLIDPLEGSVANISIGSDFEYILNFFDFDI